jgi:hypothetical protein
LAKRQGQRASTSDPDAQHDKSPQSRRPFLQTHPPNSQSQAKTSILRSSLIEILAEVGGFVSLGLSLEDASPMWRRDLSQASFVDAVGRPYEGGGVNTRDPGARFTAARLIDATIVADALGFDPVQNPPTLP